MRLDKPFHVIPQLRGSFRGCKLAAYIDYAVGLDCPGSTSVRWLRERMEQDLASLVYAPSKRRDDTNEEAEVPRHVF